jgi:hypothetical protein
LNKQNKAKEQKKHAIVSFFLSNKHEDCKKLNLHQLAAVPAEKIIYFNKTFE